MAVCSQCVLSRHGEQMSLRKPLVRYETSSRAHLVSDSATTTTSSSSSMPPRRRTTGKRRRTGKVRATKGKPRVVKGRVNVRVAGYLGVQKLAPSKLIPYLPANKVKQAAKRALVASGASPSQSSRGGKRRRVRRRKGKRKGRRKRVRKQRTRRKRS